MKMKQKDFERLEKCINHAMCRYPWGYKAYRDMGLSEERWRWDLVWEFCKSGLYPVMDYLNDDHIDTALRKITATS